MFLHVLTDPSCCAHEQTWHPAAIHHNRLFSNRLHVPLKGKLVPTVLHKRQWTSGNK